MPIIMAPCHLSLVVSPRPKGDNLIPTLICQLGKIEPNIFGPRLSLKVNFWELVHDLAMTCIGNKFVNIYIYKELEEGCRSCIF